MRPGARTHRHEPTVSVVIPTYNRVRLVLEAIESVRLQRVGPVEIIVVDDGSPDDTVRRCRALDDPPVVIPLPRSGVIARVRNVGIRRATGRYIAFLDSDDLWLPGKLQSQLACFDAHPEIGGVYTNQLR